MRVIRTNRIRRPGLLLLTLFCVQLPLAGSVAAPQLTAFDQPAAHEGLPGTLVLVGGTVIPEEVSSRFVLGIPADTSVVILSAAADDPNQAAASAISWLQASGIDAVVVPDPKTEGEQQLSELSDCLRTAGGVWICGDQQTRLESACQHLEVEEMLRSVVRRGGIIGGTSAGAAMLSRVINTSECSQPVLSTGLRIDEATAVFISGRKVQVAGSGTVSIQLTASDHYPATEIRLRSGQLADLTQLRRANEYRASGLNPGEPQHGPPRVASGALVIVGGGTMPEIIVRRFIQLAGGDNADIVVLPTAVPRAEALRQGVPGFLARATAGRVRVLPWTRPEEIESAEFRESLRSATGIWFGGGRQWNFVDAYEGTSAIALFHDVLRRGGVIGGSSAGATIQGEYLVRGHPLGNTVMMAEGYERGFGFLPGTAIDQHFSQRGRRPDLLPVIQRHPKLLGIGLDEGTAIVVQGCVAEVIGLHSAHFLTAGALSAIDSPQLTDPDDGLLDQVYMTVSAGESIDLSQLSVVVKPEESDR